MNLFKKAALLGFGLYLFGALGFAIFVSIEFCLWFLVGGGFAILNLLAAAYLVVRGLPRMRNKALFSCLVILKSVAFVGVVGVVLMFARPLLLPFTLGVGIVIFSLVLWAALESLKTLKVKKIKLD